MVGPRLKGCIQVIRSKNCIFLPPSLIFGFTQKISSTFGVPEFYFRCVSRSLCTRHVIRFLVLFCRFLVLFLHTVFCLLFLHFYFYFILLAERKSYTRRKRERHQTLDFQTVSLRYKSLFLYFLIFAFFT